MPARISKSLFARNDQAVSLALNEARVALLEGNLEMAESLAARVLENRRASRTASLSAELIKIQAKSRRGVFTGLLDRLEDLLQKTPKRNYQLEAEVCNEILRVCFRSGNLGIGAQRGEEILRENSGNWPQTEIVQFMCQLSSCHYHRGDIARAEEVASRALSLAENSMSTKAKTFAYWQSASLSLFRGDFPNASNRIQQARDWASEGGHKHIVPILDGNAALIMLDLPNIDPDRIYRLAETAYVDLISQNNPSAAAYVCEVLSEIELRKENYDAALEHVKRALTDLPSQVPGPKIALLVQIAKIHARAGRYREAGEHLLAAIHQITSEEPSLEIARQWGDIARIYVEIGLADKGVYAYERAMQMSGLLREEQDIQVK